MIDAAFTRANVGLGAKRAAFTLVESLVSILVVSVLLVAALNTVGSAWAGQQMIGDRSLARLMAEELLAEVLRQPYSDPDESPTFGVEASESGTSRAGFDDVDDYHLWQASPPELKDGTLLSNYPKWERSVQVYKVDPDDVTTITGTDYGVKRVTVTVKHDSVVVAEVVGVRCGPAVTELAEPIAIEY